MKKAYHSSTIQRALDVLNLFKEYNSLSFTDMQQLLGFNKSTLFRVLATLSSNRYLSKDESGRYELGVNIFILGIRISREHQLKSVATDFMKRLSEELDLTVHLGILDEKRVVIIEKTDPHRNIKMVSRLGSSVPVHCTGQGKALLAYSSRETVESMIKLNGLERYTPHTITRAEDLFRELDTVRSRGYAIDDSEHEKHIRCVAVPILNEAGRIEAALSITGTVIDFPGEETIHKTAQMLKDVRDEIRREMGYLRD
jgi:IclR family transcriptional regulator, KDG regulon repressor